MGGPAKKIRCGANKSLRPTWAVLPLFKSTSPIGSYRTVPKIQLEFPVIDEYVLVLSGKLILTDAGDHVFPVS